MPISHSHLSRALRDCWAYTMQTFYNESTKEFDLRSGAEIEPIDFGGMDGVDTLGEIDGAGPSLSTTHKLNAIPEF